MIRSNPLAAGRRHSVSARDDGTVVAVGDGKLLDSGTRAEFQVKPGDTVLLGKWGGTDISFDGEDYLIITEDDVLAVID